MLKRLKAIWSTPDLSKFDHPVARERLIQSGRIAIIDDEEPLLISELKDAGFSVDHDRDGSNLAKFSDQLYDVAIIDYHGVGQRLGAAQGLELLRHIRRVSPRTRLIAYTSRSLTAAESDFFRLSHAVLPKDMGLGDSLTLIESELQKSLSKEHLFQALAEKLSIVDSERKQKLREALAKSLAKGDLNKFKTTVITMSGPMAEKAAEVIIGRIFGG